MQFTDVKIEWSLKTFIFYLVIILGCYLIAWMFRKQSIKWGTYQKQKYSVSLVIVGIILLVIKCFNTTGRDLRTGYAYNFASATSMENYRDQTVEVGFRILMVIVRKFTNDYAVFLFVVGILTIFPVIYFINKYRYKIDMPTAILLFTSIYFINGFSAYRQYMAVSISLFMLDTIIEKKPYKALFWIAVSSTIHIACFALIIPYVLCFSRLFSKKMIAISIVVFFALFCLGRGEIALLLKEHERYRIYFVNQEIRFGLEQIVYYAPMFFLVYLNRKYKVNKNISRIAYVYIITGFAFGMFSYVLPIFGRMQSIFIPIIILIPYYIKQYKEHYEKSKRMILNILTVFYSLARFTIWITQYYGLEDLMPYTNVFGKII